MNNDPTSSFGQTAKGLARNPLGIIALFICACGPSAAYPLPNGRGLDCGRAGWTA